MLDGWDKSKGGSIVRGIGTVVRQSATGRYCWPCCEGVAASAFLNVIEADPVYERSYRGIWNFIATQFIDDESGGCRGQIDDILRPTPVDIYHALRSLPDSNSTNNWERDKMPWGWRVLHGALMGYEISTFLCIIFSSAPRLNWHRRSRIFGEPSINLSL